jgi:hypothetical protein
MSEVAPPDVGRDQLDAVLAFLPIFERLGYAFGEWISHTGQLPYFDYSPEVLAFEKALYQQGIIYIFDWPAWSEDVKRYQRDAEALQSADLLALRKLLTAHVRADRFVEGHLASVLESGHITTILRRLKQLRDALPAR